MANTNGVIEVPEEEKVQRSGYREYELKPLLNRAKKLCPNCDIDCLALDAKEICFGVKQFASTTLVPQCRITKTDSSTLTVRPRTSSGDHYYVGCKQLEDMAKEHFGSLDNLYVTRKYIERGFWHVFCVIKK